MASLHVVTGPPCSGKSTYVSEHAKAGEVRIDLDPIAQALGAEEPHGSTGDIRSAAIAARQGAIDRAIDESLSAWIVHGNPSEQQMSLYKKVGAEIIEMDADLDTCLARAEADGRPAVDFALIREWFDEHDQERSSNAPKGAFFLAREAEMPFRPELRQYRDFSVSNFRATSGDEETQNQTYTVRGYFTTFDEEYPLFDDYYESIDPHAFDACDMSDVLFQVNHDGHVYARNRNGSLLISTDNHGGVCEADLSGSKKGREELYESITNGLVDRMSFGFMIAEDGFEYTVDGDGVYHTRITKISKLYDVSAIEGFPANDGTIISARSLHDSVEEAERKKQELEQAEQVEEEVREKDTSSLRKRKALALELECLQLGH